MRIKLFDFIVNTHRFMKWGKDEISDFLSHLFVPHEVRFEGVSGIALFVVIAASMLPSTRQTIFVPCIFFLPKLALLVIALYSFILIFALLKKSFYPFCSAPLRGETRCLAKVRVVSQIIS